MLEKFVVSRADLGGIQMPAGGLRLSVSPSGGRWKNRNAERSFRLIIRFFRFAAQFRDGRFGRALRRRSVGILPVQDRAQFFRRRIIEQIKRVGRESSRAVRCLNRWLAGSFAGSFARLICQLRLLHKTPA